MEEENKTAGQEDWQKAQDAAEEKAQQDFVKQQSSAHDAFMKQQEEAKARAQAMEEQFRQTRETDPSSGGNPSADGEQAQQNFQQAQQNFQQAQQNFQQTQQNFHQQASQNFQQPNGGRPVGGPVPEKAHTEAMISLILGVAALIFGLLAGILGIFSHIFFLFFPTALGIAGLILSSEAKKNGYKGGMQTAGFWLSLIGLILGCLAFISCGACAAISCTFCHGR